MFYGWVFGLFSERKSFFLIKATVFFGKRLVIGEFVRTEERVREPQEVPERSFYAVAGAWQNGKMTQMGDALRRLFGENPSVRKDLPLNEP